VAGRQAGPRAGGQRAGRAAAGEAAAGPAADGRDVQLTIDQASRRGAGGARGHRQRWKAKSATAIVLDPRTGEIARDGHRRRPTTTTTCHDLSAMAACTSWTRNRAVQDMYEPGRPFKVVTFAAALSAGIIYPADEVPAAVRDPGRRPQDPR
jgi:cell division protein FtsI/penicillin-binding protein 2